MGEDVGMCFLPMGLRGAILGAFLVICAAAFVRGDDSGRHGKSRQGEVFDEGPRRAAVLLGPEKVGRVEFAVTAKTVESRRFFEQGVAQLHGFAYFEAERSFREALRGDSECAMALWGLGVANRFHPVRAREFLAKAVGLPKKVSEKEKRWLDIYAAYFAEKPAESDRRRALVKGLEGLVVDYPADVEPKVWLVLELWLNADHGIAMESRVAVDALLAEVLRQAPDHPGAHHLRIHLWNRHADERALGSAERCGQSGSGVAHLWHMPGHTYSALHRYADAAWHQEASARVDHAWMKDWWLMPDQIHNYAHNNDWLVETLGYLGRVREAVDLAKNMVELPRLAPRVTVVGRSRPRDADSSNRMGTRRLIELLVDFELWQEGLELCETPYLPPQKNHMLESLRCRFRVLAHLALGSTTAGESALGELRAAVQNLRAERLEAAEDAERKAEEAGKSGAESANGALDVLHSRKGELAEARDALAEAEAWWAMEKGNSSAADRWIGEIKKLPQSRRILFELKRGRPAEALKLLEKLTRNGQFLPETLAVEVLWKNGDQPAAQKAFHALRSTVADAEIPALKRLQPVLEGAGFESGAFHDGSWRRPAADTLTRPSLEKLGPFRWSPVDAPPWQLPDGSGQVWGPERFDGQPLLLIFYLGGGCVHCVEQLNTFAPLAESYSKAGIPIVAVSTDSPADLRKTQEKGGLPFPIVADPGQTVFRRYGAWDDFEQQPLHGVFLLDARRQIRWMDISASPFVEADWLLAEAQRLLRFPVPGRSSVRAGEGGN
jgi:peroxiredoxin